MEPLQFSELITTGSEDEQLSDKLLSEYLGKLFAEGEFIDVVNFAQKAIEKNPLNLDMVVYRACAYIVLQVSDLVATKEKQVAAAIEQLQMISELMGLEQDYDHSLDYYIALGHLVLGQFSQADKLIDDLADLDDIPDAVDYYESSRDHWISKKRYLRMERIPDKPLPS